MEVVDSALELERVQHFGLVDLPLVDLPLLDSRVPVDSQVR